MPYVMAQAGHTDPKMTLGPYAKVMASKTDHGATLDSLVALPAETSQRSRGQGKVQPCCSM